MAKIVLIVSVFIGVLGSLWQIVLGKDSRAHSATGDGLDGSPSSCASAADAGCDGADGGDGGGDGGGD